MAKTMIIKRRIVLVVSFVSISYILQETVRKSLQIFNNDSFNNSISDIDIINNNNNNNNKKISNNTNNSENNRQKKKKKRSSFRKNTNKNDEADQWYVFYSEKSKRHYYYNPCLKLATWVLPSQHQYLHETQPTTPLPQTHQDAQRQLSISPSQQQQHQTNDKNNHDKSRSISTINAGGDNEILKIRAPMPLTKQRKILGLGLSLFLTLLFFLFWRFRHGSIPSHPDTATEYRQRLQSTTMPDKVLQTVEQQNIQLQEVLITHNSSDNDRQTRSTTKKKVPRRRTRKLTTERPKKIEEPQIHKTEVESSQRKAEAYTVTKTPTLQATAETQKINEATKSETISEVKHSSSLPHRPKGCFVPLAHIFVGKCRKIVRERPLFDAQFIVDGMLQ